MLQYFLTFYRNDQKHNKNYSVPADEAQSSAENASQQPI